MKIALVTPRFCDDPTSISVLGGLEAAYRRLGHETVVIGRLKPRSGDGASLGFAVRPIGRSGAEAAFHLRDCGFVHVNLIGPLDAPAIGVWLCCAARKLAFGVTFHDFGNPSLGVEPRWRSGLLARMLRGASWVAANSSFVARGVEWRLGLPKGAVRVVPYGIGRPDGVGGARRPSPFVLCLSRLMPYKGVDALLLAWAELGKRAAETELVVCGPDECGGHYQGLARRLGLSSVAFLGERPRSDVWPLLRSCLFLVQPSRHEAFGLAIVEAMSCGKAVLATRSGGPEEIVADGRTGLLVRACDPAALARGLELLLRDAALRDRLGKAARKAASRYSWDEAARRYCELMERA